MIGGCGVLNAPCDLGVHLTKHHFQGNSSLCLTNVLLMKVFVIPINIISVSFQCPIAPGFACP